MCSPLARSFGTTPVNTNVLPVLDAIFRQPLLARFLPFLANTDT